MIAKLLILHGLLIFGVDAVAQPAGIGVVMASLRPAAGPAPVPLGEDLGAARLFTLFGVGLFVVGLLRRGNAS